ncbi:protocadherin Fat 4-like, partial [Centruroides sculpturatus]|uniref:protocadherin Fat 4-like n=1 Tax=Centruroides sculpturatus TaxID=218467 RepID=UPI000C6E54D8
MKCILLIFLFIRIKSAASQACQFYPLGETRRFEKVAENIPVDHEVFRVQVFPRVEFRMDAMDNSLSDIQYFKAENVDDKTISVKVAKSLEDLVDKHDPQSVLKFKLTCKGSSGTEEAFLPVTIYIEDINDHAPEFQNTPYHLEVDELTPVGLTVFRGIHAVDRDKPNTANSDVTYSIVGGNENNSFALSDPIEGILVVNKPLDFDHGVREFQIKIQASDHGSPHSLSTLTTLTIRVKDSDDQNPKFTQDVYKTSVLESSKVTGARIRSKLVLEPPIHAYDQDLGINAALRYDIIHGNDRKFFEMHEQTGELYLVKEVDLETLSNKILGLRIQATQIDNVLRQAVAKVDVEVLDVNDNSPVFEFDTYNITVMENLPIGFTVVQVYALDEDSGENGQFFYKLEEESDAFNIDPQTGGITVKDSSKLDRETQDLIRLKVRAIDPDLGNNGLVQYSIQQDSVGKSVPFRITSLNGSVVITEAFSKITKKPTRYTFFVLATDRASIESERRTSTAVVNVDIIDVNNNPPEFIGAPYEAFIGESLPPGAFVYQLQARDTDVNTVLSYNIVGGNDENQFTIDPKTGRIHTAVVMDFEKRQSYDLVVQASDGINSVVAGLTVHIVDINDQQPRFIHNIYNFSVFEELQANLTVGSVLAIDADSGKNALVQYKILGEQGNNAFFIDHVGNILTRRSLDREKESSLEFLLVAFDGGTPQLSGTTTVMIQVEDINDNPPHFESDTYIVNVPEEEDPPYKVFQIKVLAVEKKPNVNPEAKKSTTTVEIHLLDANDNNPQFVPESIYNFHATELELPGTIIGNVRAIDPDLGNNGLVQYSIQQDSVGKSVPFRITSLNGSVVITEAFSKITKKPTRYTFFVLATDRASIESERRTSTAVVNVDIIDVNNNPPEFIGAPYEAFIGESLPPGAFVYQLQARDTDVNTVLSYNIVGGNDENQFTIDPKTGRIHTAVVMDFEKRQSYDLVVQASDGINSVVAGLTVHIVDINDQQPRFIHNIYNFSVFEELQANLTVGSVLDVFRIDNASGTLILISLLDYESKDKHSFTVYATDSGQPPLTGSAFVTIKVQNINEFAPEFMGLPYDFWVEENAIRGTRVGQIKAVDGDGNNVKYSLTGGDAGFFSIDENIGHVYVQKDLDSRTSYTFIARATDDGVPQNNSIGVQVTIHVRERNDYPPVFTQLTYYGKVNEKEQTNYPIVKVQANDRDLQNNSLTYIIKSGNEEGIFAISPSSGEIRVIPNETHKLDYDRKKNYILLVEARDSHTSPLYGLAVVMIEVLDVNNHPPVFSQTSYSAFLPENLPAGHCFLKTHANGGDTVDIISYSIDKNNIPFTINPKTGDICLKQSLDREAKDNFDFIVKAYDGVYETRVPVIVQVEDENDNPPKFERDRYVVSIPPHSTAGRIIVQVQAIDPDLASNGEITYWIKNTHGLFEVDSQTGVVRLMTSLPKISQRNTTYEMEVFARDHGATSNIGKTMVIVRVSTMRNNPPKFEKLGYSVSVDENRANVPLLNVHAFDPDDGKAGKLKYRIVRSTVPNAFRIEEDTGKIILVSALDYETTKHLELTVEAQDESKEPQFATTTIQVTVNDMNDNSPVFLSMPHVIRIPLSTLPKQVIYTVQAVDVDSGVNNNNEIKYEMIPPSPLFAVHSKTGQIYVTQTLLPITEKLNIIATDGATFPLSSTAEITIEIFRDNADEPLPKFTSTQYLVDVDGMLEVGSTVLDVKAVIPNGNPVWYNISKPTGPALRQFTINHKTGKITTATKLSNEHVPFYDFLVSAHNRNNLMQFVETSVVVKIKPESLRCPKFPFSEYFTSIKETAPPDMVVLPTLLVEDMAIFDKLSYQITEDNSNDNFFVDIRSNNVSLRVKKPLDRDTMNPTLHGMYTLAITASNQRCSGSTYVRIYVEDVNDNSPVFEKSLFVIDLKENSQAGHVVAQLTATDRDELDKRLRYFIVDGNGGQDFRIEGSTGVLSVKVPPDRETIPKFMLRVLAIDSANNTGFADVQINILDENDWTPTFSNETYLLNVTEGTASIGTKMYLPVVDKDEGLNSEMDIFIEEGNSEKLFKLEPYEKGAVLTVIKELDREQFGVTDTALRLVLIAAKDRGIPPLTGTTTVAVVIHDINDSPPVFDKEIYYKFISENVPVGAIITTMVAKDADADYNTDMKYSFAPDTGNVPFSIDPKSGLVNVTRQLDISESREYAITVEAFDGLWTSETQLNIFVQEAEERDPRFHQLQYRFSVLENIVGAKVGQVELQARMQRLFSQTKYSIVNVDLRRLFNITKDGYIFTKVGLDREKRSQYTFTVMLQERKPSTKVSVCEVTVDVLDVNDEIPTFKHSYEGKIKENSPPGTAVVIDPAIQAIDKDSGNNSIIRYSLSGKGSDLFSILENGIVVYTSSDPLGVLDRERQEVYNLKVTATDLGNLSSSTQLTINIEDENDNVPVFQHGPLRILLPETARPGSKIAEVRALDADGKGPNSKVEYFITSGDKGEVRVDRQTGELYVVSKLKPSSAILLNITAVDGHGLASFTKVNITIVDVNDHHPTFVKSEYTFTVKEGNYTGKRLQLGVLHAVDQDTGKNGLVDYTIVKTIDKDFPFSVDVQTGELFARGIIDRESKPIYRFTVMALDYGEPPQNSTINVTIEVQDVNDESPRFFTDPYLAQVFENLDPGQEVTRITAYDSDSNLNGQVFYKLGDGHENKFYIDSKDGTIWTLAKLDYEKKPFYNMSVIAYDQGVPSLSSTAKLWVTVIDTNDAIPEFAKSVYTLEVAENRQPGDIVFTLDAGEGEFTYILNISFKSILSDFRQYEYILKVVVKIKPESLRCPKFPFSEYFTSIKETAPPDMVVLPTLLVEDMAIFDKLSYQITEDNSNDNFFVDIRSNNVSLRVKKPLDRDTMNPTLHGMYTLAITASNQRCSGSTYVRIYVEDVNDNSPNSQAGHVVAQLTATDRDELDKRLRYFIVDGNGGQDFRIEGSTGVLSVKVPPDRETIPKFMLRVLAIDSANNTGFADVQINILDENDWTPTFSNETYLLNVTEGTASIGTKMYLPVVDKDEGLNSEMDIFIEEGNSEKLFKLEPYEKGAVLTVIKELDREQFGVTDTALRLVLIAAKDRGIPPLTGTTTVAVVIHDINDSPPVFDKEIYYKFISENVPVGAIITTMVAKDADADYNTDMKYSFAPDTGNVPFSIDPKSGLVNVTRQLDISESREYAITVEAFDGLWTSETQLNIFVQEAEERDPRFHQLQYRFSVLENIVGAKVGQVELQARMQRLFSQTKYSIVNVDLRRLFNITKDGYIFTKVGLDREKRSQYTFTVMLQERKPSTKVSVCEVTVDVLDVNDEIPTFKHSYEGKIKENSPPGTAVVIDPAIQAIDKDSGNNSIIRYSLSGKGSDLFSILENGIVVYTSSDPLGVLDRERQEVYNLKVTATDLGNLSSSTQLTINIEDENDNVPVFQHGPLRILLPETARPGSKIAEVRALDADGKGPNSKVEYFITSGDKGEVRVDRQTGELYVVSKLKPSSAILLNITAVDGHGLASFTKVNITIVDVNDHHPTFVKSEYTFTVKEGNYTGKRLQLGVLHAVDQDTGKNGLVDYTIVKTIDKDFPFSVDVQTGELFARGIIDRESKPIYRFTVMALDYGEPPQNSTINVTIEVQDVNDESPRFFTDPYLAQVFENLDPGQEVTRITAYDSDSNLNGQVFYKLGDDGTIWTLAKLDYEKKPFYNMSVIAYDQGVPSLSSTAKLWVTVIDTNDAIPEFAKSVYTLEVAENRQPGDIVFTLDAGEGEFTYILNSKTDDISYHLAYDEALVVIEVGDENDNPPIFETNGKPVVAAVPLEASFGYQVVKLK